PAQLGAVRGRRGRAARGGRDGGLRALPPPTGREEGRQEGMKPVTMNLALATGAAALGAVLGVLIGGRSQPIPTAPGGRILVVDPRVPTCAQAERTWSPWAPLRVLPRLSQAARDQLADPPPGLLIFNDDTGLPNLYTTGGWQTVPLAQTIAQRELPPGCPGLLVWLRPQQSVRVWSPTVGWSSPW